MPLIGLYITLDRRTAVFAVFVVRLSRPWISRENQSHSARPLCPCSLSAVRPASEVGLRSRTSLQVVQIRTCSSNQE